MTGLQRNSTEFIAMHSHNPLTSTRVTGNPVNTNATNDGYYGTGQIMPGLSRDKSDETGSVLTAQPHRPTVSSALEIAVQFMAALVPSLLRPCHKISLVSVSNHGGSAALFGAGDCSAIADDSTVQCFANVNFPSLNKPHTLSCALRTSMHLAYKAKY
jgi:hypothetical protein